MVERKVINARVKQARVDGDKELISMLEHYLQLRYDFIPQIKKRFLESDSGGLFTPHRCKLREEVIISEYKKLKT